MSVQLGELIVSRETQEKLEHYAALVRKWSAHINLVSRKSLDELWTRHIVDSAQLFQLAEPKGDWLDLGTGGGFPGMVVAIIGTEQSPTRHVTMIESDRRKAAFLRTVARETQTTCTILSERIESVPRQEKPILSARALGRLDQLLGYAERHMSLGGIALFPKGETWKEEVATAKEQWSFELEEFTSWTAPNAAVLRIREVSRV